MKKQKSMESPQSLLDMVEVPMSDRQRRAIKRIDDEDCSMITYLTRKHHKELGESYDQDYYDAGCIALKQYYATTIFDLRNLHAISSSLDPFWHSHILDTVSYEVLAEDIGGFMHHDPLNMLDAHKVDAVRDIYHYTQEVLEKIFGRKNLDERFYPSEPDGSILVCLHDVDYDAIELPDDIFPLNSKIEQHRIYYSNEVRRRMIREALNSEFG